MSSGCKAAAPLYSWATAQLEHAAALHKAAPLLAELAQLDAELGRLRERRRLAAERVERLSEELQLLKVEEAVLLLELGGAGDEGEGGGEGVEVKDAAESTPTRPVPVYKVNKYSTTPIRRYS